MTAPVVLKPRLERKLIYRTLAEIREKEGSRPEGAGMSGAYGFTEPDFQFVHNALLDWKPCEGKPGFVSFQGLVVNLNVRVDVYLPSEYQRWSDVLEPIARHENLHVADAESILHRSLPASLRRDPTFRSYFIDRTPISEETRRYMIPNRVADLVRKTFDELWDDAVGNLDTAANYSAVAHAVQSALARHHP